MTIDGLPDWSFEISEASMGVYRIHGSNSLGWTIDLAATSESDLLAEARKAVHQMISRNPSRFSETRATKEQAPAIQGIEAWIERVSHSQPGFETAVRRFAGPKPGIVVDFFGAETAGRITAWFSGEFDFEVLRDGAITRWEHLDASESPDLETAFSAFTAALRNA